MPFLSRYVFSKKYLIITSWMGIIACDYGGLLVPSCMLETCSGCCKSRARGNETATRLEHQCTTIPEGCRHSDPRDSQARLSSADSILPGAARRHAHPRQAYSQQPRGETQS